MEITVIGWYGTETIGDRAILSGVFRVLSEVFSSFNVHLGSLYPFYTERTLREDVDFYHAISLNKLSTITIFDSQNSRQLRDSIQRSDLLIVGGGPLMDLSEMNMLEYAFIFAKKKHVKTMLFGCGWGPLKNKKSIETTVRLVELSDCVVFRDGVSMNQCLSSCSDYSYKVHSSIDPAFFACHYFKSNVKEERTEDHVAINFRDVSLEGDHYAKNGVSEDLLSNIVRDVATRTELPVHLVPMHNFFVGGDDRVILNRIEKKVALANVKALQLPLSLYDTMKQYYHAKLCVGMRFHAVVLQTMLNGNNYVVDYTDPSTGKIAGMMRQFKIMGFYEKRYFSLHTNNDMFVVDMLSDDRFECNQKVVEDYYNIYVDCLKKLWS